MRNDLDEVWDEWFNDACALAEDVGATIDTPRTTKIQKNRSNVPFDTPSTYYRRVVAVPFLDSFSQGLAERFSPDNRCMKSIMGLVPSILLTSMLTVEVQIQELMFWETDLPSPENPQAEIRSWKRHWEPFDKVKLPEDLVMKTSSQMLGDLSYWVAPLRSPAVRLKGHLQHCEG